MRYRVAATHVSLNLLARRLVLTTWCLGNRILTCLLLSFSHRDILFGMIGNAKANDSKLRKPGSWVLQTTTYPYRKIPFNFPEWFEKIWGKVWIFGVHKVIRLTQVDPNKNSTHPQLPHHGQHFAWWIDSEVATSGVSWLGGFRSNTETWILWNVNEYKDNWNI